MIAKTSEETRNLFKTDFFVCFSSFASYFLKYEKILWIFRFRKYKKSFLFRKHKKHFRISACWSIRNFPGLDGFLLFFGLGVKYEKWKVSFEKIVEKLSFEKIQETLFFGEIIRMFLILELESSISGNTSNFFRGLIF